MNICIVDIDSHNFPNLALMKISGWHKKQGHNVNNYLHVRDRLKKFDKTYMSKIFTFTLDPCYKINCDELVKGGYGYSSSEKLPPEIEHCYPDYSIYPQYDFALGYLSRGCIRNCGFCVVPKVEGKLRQVAEVEEFWKDQKEIILMDNNFTALPNRVKILQKLAATKAVINFKQGLDIRLVDDDFARALAKCKLPREMHFAFDHISMKDDVVKGVQTLRKYIGKRDLTFYVLCGYNSTFEEDVERLNILRDMKRVKPFVMLYRDSENKVVHDVKYKHLARWANRQELFGSVKFEDYGPYKKHRLQLQFQF